MVKFAGSPKEKVGAGMNQPDSGKGALGTADTRRVMQLLPHRYPFLMVDRIVEMDRDESAVGIKNVSMNEPFFQGQFPNFPIMPGVLIIEDDVEIGANSCVDRGALRDTVIGAGTKIDNLVQIGHNVVIGRHCVIAGHVGIAGSAELEDFVVMGGQSGMVGHIRIGRGAQIGGASHPKEDVAPGARMGGTPAIPLAEWARQLAVLKRLTQRQGRSGAA